MLWNRYRRRAEAGKRPPTPDLSLIHIYFILLSGFVLGYNYNARARAGELDKVRFWKARFTRIYPIYLLSLLLSWGTLGKDCLLYTSRCV